LLRSGVSHNIIGSPELLHSASSALQLPTVEDVLKHYLWKREETMRTAGNRWDPSVKDLSKKIAKRIVEIWRVASIAGDAIISEKGIIKMFLVPQTPRQATEIIWQGSIRIRQKRCSF